LGIHRMSAYDRFIAAATTRLDLGHRTRWVVDVLVGWIASHPLGMDGLQQQFEQAGLGARFQSWQRPTPSPCPWWPANWNARSVHMQ